MKKHVTVRWKDSVSFAPWKKITELISQSKKDQVIETTGYLVEDNDEYVCVSQNKKGEYCSHTTKIYKSQIVSVETEGNVQETKTMKGGDILARQKEKLSFLKTITGVEVLVMILAFLLVAETFIVLSLTGEHSATFICSSNGNVETFDRLHESMKTGWSDDVQKRCVNGHWHDTNSFLLAGIPKELHLEKAKELESSKGGMKTC